MSPEPRFSVIIPARNAARTLAVCLESIFRSRSRPQEVIVVDDGSSDGTGEVASRFPCRVIRIESGAGPMPPRLAGARQAASPLLVFVDSDVRVSPETFSLLLENFSDRGVHAVTGLLARRAPSASFFSDFKNEYMNYVFSRQPRDVGFVYGSLWAVRGECLPAYEPLPLPFGSPVSDTELGLVLKMNNLRIALDHRLEVAHLKEYGFTTLLKNDFIIPFSFALLLAEYRIRPEEWTRERRFSHVRFSQTAAAALAFAGLALLPLAAASGSRLLEFLAFAPLALFFCHWRNFLRRLSGRGPGYLLKTCLFLPLDAAVMFCGMSAGFIFSAMKILFKPGLNISRQDA